MSEVVPLPVGCEYWPVRPGDRTTADYNFDGRGSVCHQQRNAWYCTREPGHPLPHVAMGSRVVAVWDQLWFADQDHDRMYPVESVTTTTRRRLNAPT
jgi:hypothetical protein